MTGPRYTNTLLFLLTLDWMGKQIPKNRSILIRKQIILSISFKYLVKVDHKNEFIPDGQGEVH